MSILFADTADTEAAGGFWPAVGRVLWEAGGRALQVLVTVVVCILIAWLLRFVIRRLVRRVVAGAKVKADVVDTRALERSPLAAVRIVQRTRTLGSILQNIVNVVVVVIAIVICVNILAPSVLGSFALLTAAIGAGLGFGAQNIVKDVLNGLFIVAEDQIGIGDVVDLGLATGVVEYVSVRVTHVRDVNGTLWYVRNGEITRIGNMSLGWSRVVIDLGLPADVDIAAVEGALLDTASGLADDPKWHSRIIDRPEVWGLESIDGETLVVRLVIKARPNAKDDVARELRMRLRGTIETLGVTIPSMNTVTLEGGDGAQRVRGANPPKTKPNPVPMPTRPSWRPRRKAKAAGGDPVAAGRADGAPTDEDGTDDTRSDPVASPKQPEDPE